LTAATVTSYVSAYWSGLKAALDVVDTAIYTDLAANAAVTLELFDHSFLTTAQENQAQALLICIDAAGMPGIGGWSPERHYSKLKIADRTWTNTEGKDWAVGELCRLLKITFKEYMAKTSTQRQANYTKTLTNTYFIGGDLDQRGKLFRDYSLDDVTSDRKTTPLDNRYL